MNSSSRARFCESVLMSTISSTVASSESRRSTPPPPLLQDLSSSASTWWNAVGNSMQVYAECRAVILSQTLWNARQSFAPTVFGRKKWTVMCAMAFQCDRWTDLTSSERHESSTLEEIVSGWLRSAACLCCMDCAIHFWNAVIRRMEMISQSTEHEYTSWMDWIVSVRRSIALRVGRRLPTKLDCMADLHQSSDQWMSMVLDGLQFPIASSNAPLSTEDLDRYLSVWHPLWTLWCGVILGITPRVDAPILSTRESIVLFLLDHQPVTLTTRHTLETLTHAVHQLNHRSISWAHDPSAASRKDYANTTLQYRTLLWFTLTSLLLIRLLSSHVA